MNAAFRAWLCPFQGGRYGMAVLSRYSDREFRSYQITRGKRAANCTRREVELPSGESSMVVNVHFDWVNDDSYRSLKPIATNGFLDQLTIAVHPDGRFSTTLPIRELLKLLAAASSRAKKPEQDG